MTFTGQLWVISPYFSSLPISQSYCKDKKTCWRTVDANVSSCKKSSYVIIKSPVYLSVPTEVTEGQEEEEEED